MREMTFTTAICLGALVAFAGFLDPAAAQTCTGRSIAVDQSVVAQRVRTSHEDLVDDLSDTPSSLYAARPQRGRNGR